MKFKIGNLVKEPGMDDSAAVRVTKLLPDILWFGKKENCVEIDYINRNNFRRQILPERRLVKVKTIAE